MHIVQVFEVIFSFIQTFISVPFNGCMIIRDLHGNLLIALGTKLPYLHTELLRVFIRDRLYLSGNVLTIFTFRLAYNLSFFFYAIQIYSPAVNFERSNVGLVLTYLTVSHILPMWRQIIQPMGFKVIEWLSNQFSVASIVWVTIHLR